MTKEKLDGFNLYTLEYVHATVTVTHARRGDVEVMLHCPSGTLSTLAATRKLDECVINSNIQNFYKKTAQGEGVCHGRGSA